MIAIRAQAGAGKNFIATLLCKHYNASNLIYYDNAFNEYFNEPHTTINPNGNILEAYWNENSWNFIHCSEAENTLKIYHEHEWDSNFVDKTFVKNINEGYFIYREDPEAIEFTNKLRLIKKAFGVRPIMAFYNDHCSIDPHHRNSLYLKSITKVKSYHELFQVLKISSAEYSYEEFMTHWIRFLKFLNNNIPSPFNYSLSNVHVEYFLDWLKNKKWELCDLDNYYNKIYFMLNKLMIRFQSTPGENALNDIEKLAEARHLVPYLYAIEYKDMFFNLKSTGTVLDNYRNEIYSYTAKNVNLVKKFEKIYEK